jgi:PAS domain S-box-containing protein
MKYSMVEQEKIQKCDDLFESIFNNTMVGVVLLSIERVVLRANLEAATMFGYETAEELIGAEIGQFHISDDSSQNLLEEYYPKIKNGESVKFDYLFKHKTGKHFWVSASGKAVDNAQPPNIEKGVVWVLEDISERKNAEQMLKEAHDELESFFDNAMVGIAVLKGGRYIHRVNRTIVDMFGYENEEEFKGKSVRNWHISDKHFEDFGKQFYNSLVNHTVEEVDVRLKKKDGTYTWVAMYGRAMDRAVPADLDKGVVWVLRDINNRKEIEFTLNEQNRKLAEANATKNKFFKIIGHDLKSPIGQIVNFASLIEDNFEHYSDADLIKFIKLMKETSFNSLKLLDNLLTWASSQANSISFQPIECNLHYAVETTIELLRRNAGEKNIEIVNQIDSEIELFADRNMLSTILRNLISNAVKFTFENGSVTISAVQGSNQTVISIADNGCGISDSTKEKLFKIESGVSTRGTNNEKGTGLGLILCKEFVDKHNGEIWIKSEEGKGSVFSFSIPR